jgi:hypothetical protein
MDGTTMKCTVGLNEARSRATFGGPTWYYDEDGDCIEFITSPDRFYAERKDDWVTAYYSYETQELVGSMIKDVSKLLMEWPGFSGIEVCEGKVRLSHLYRLSGWSCARHDQAAATMYNALISKAEQSDARIELATC